MMSVEEVVQQLNAIADAFERGATVEACEAILPLLKFGVDLLKLVGVQSQPCTPEQAEALKCACERCSVACTKPQEVQAGEVGREWDGSLIRAFTDALLKIAAVIIPLFTGPKV